MANRDIVAIADEVKKHKSALIFAHHNPDGDAIGSAVASGLILKELGYEVVDYAVQKDIRGYYEILSEGVNFFKPIKESYDLAVIVDCSTFEYIYNNELISRCKRKVLIDHHISNKTTFADFTYVDGNAAAAGELVYELCIELDITPTRDIANAIYVAIVEDTGHFQYSNTTKKTHEIVANLYSYSQDFAKISQKLHQYDVSKIKLNKAAYDNLRFYNDNKLVIIAFTKDGIDFDYDEIDTDGVIDIGKYINTTELSIFIKEYARGEFKISMRSMVDNLDVSEIATRFNGGGHRKAAGFKTEMKLDEIIEFFKGYMNEYERTNNCR